VYSFDTASKSWNVENFKAGDWEDESPAEAKEPQEYAYYEEQKMITPETYSYNNQVEKAKVTTKTDEVVDDWNNYLKDLEMHHGMEMEDYDNEESDSDDEYGDQFDYYNNYQNDYAKETTKKASKPSYNAWED